VFFFLLAGYATDVCFPRNHLVPDAGCCSLPKRNCPLNPDSPSYPPPGLEIRTPRPCSLTICRVSLCRGLWLIVPLFFSFSPLLLFSPSFSSFLGRPNPTPLICFLVHKRPLPAGNGDCCSSFCFLTFFFSSSRKVGGPTQGAFLGRVRTVLLYRVCSLLVGGSVNFGLDGSQIFFSRDIQVPNPWFWFLSRFCSPPFPPSDGQPVWWDMVVPFPPISPGVSSLAFLALYCFRIRDSVP